MATEGVGTWATWIINDPQRVYKMATGAVQRLAARWPHAPVPPTDSQDGTETAILRFLAHKNRAICAFEGWAEYNTYSNDFEAASASDSDEILRTLAARTKSMLSFQAFQLCIENAFSSVFGCLDCENLWRLLTTCVDVRCFQTRVTVISIDIRRKGSFRSYARSHHWNRFLALQELHILLPSFSRLPLIKKLHAPC